jgi:hypothetical protein
MTSNNQITSKVTRATEKYGLQAAASSVDITPVDRLPLAGWINRRKSAVEVADSLEANILLLRQNGVIAVFVSCDLLYIGYLLRRRLEELLDDSVPPSSLFTTASHTHFAPATDLELPKLGSASLDYVEQVALAISSAVRRTINATSEPVGLHYKVGTGHHAIHRRLPVVRFRLGLPPWRPRWEMRPNKQIHIDERIHVLSVESSAGHPVAVFWSYACHPVCFPRKLSISADFPGVVRRTVRERYGNIPILFSQGFSGDVRPKAIGDANRRCLSRRSPPTFGPFTAEAWKNWSSGLSKCVLNALAMTGTQVQGALSVHRRSIPTTSLGLDCGGRSISIHEVKVGDGFDIFGISAEPVNEYVAIIEAAKPGSTVIPVGCIDGVPCYLPTDQMVEQGGYESTGFRRLFGASGHFRKDLVAFVQSHIL